MAESLTPEIVRENIAALEATIAEAVATADRARSELLDWRAAERLIGKLGGGGEQTTGDAVESSEATAQPRKFDTPFREGTNKAFLYQALAEAPAVWNTANEIQVLASKLKGAIIPMSSVSPTLTEMVQKDKVLVRDGMKLALLSRSEGIRTTHVAQAGLWSKENEGGANVTRHA